MREWTHVETTSRSSVSARLLVLLVNLCTHSPPTSFNFYSYPIFSFPFSLCGLLHGEIEIIECDRSCLPKFLFSHPALLPLSYSQSILTSFQANVSPYVLDLFYSNSMTLFQQLSPFSPVSAFQLVYESYQISSKSGLKSLFLLLHCLFTPRPTVPCPLPLL